MSAERCINTIRCLAADVVQKANSGHPGMPMGMAPVAHSLWSRFMKFSPKNPHWINRDRFVLSNGHGCALQYIMLHLSGYDVSMDDLKQFRQINSKTPGHPENHVTPGIEVTTGPLGQGISNAVGLAIAREHAAAKFNKPGFELINHKVFVFTGDGCLMEGISSEACSLAGHLGLSSLIVVYDDNKISIDGHTDITFTEDVAKRYESYGWHVITVENGDSDVSTIDKALSEALAVTGKPTLIKLRTTIGYGSKNQDSHKVHGSPLGDEDIKFIKQKFGFDPTLKFFVPEDVSKVYADVAQKGEALRASWEQMYAQYKEKYPAEAAEFERIFVQNKLPEGWEKSLPVFTPKDPQIATRKLSEMCLNAICDKIPELIGGSADLAASNFTRLMKHKDFQKNSYDGRNINFGVREHAMAAVCNGLAAYGGFIPYCATFLNFIGYAFGAVRLSALSNLRVLYIMTHDSIGLGEDGPTHQPVESLIMCRAMPNMFTFRPCDGNETSGSYYAALTHSQTPSVLCLSRQNLPHLANTACEKVALGAYVLHENFDSSKDKAQVIIVSSGSEVSICFEALDRLKDKRVRIVSMPCTELFDAQPINYKKSVFLSGVPVLSVEASSVVGWDKYAHASIGLTTFGKSGPYKEVYNFFGITASNIAEKATKMIDFYNGKPVPDLVEKPF